MSNLKEYVTNILKRNDSIMEAIYRDQEHIILEWELFKIEKMNFTLEGLASSLETIADHLFIPGEEYKWGHVTAFIMYCMKVDEHFRKNHANYKTDLLIDILVTILIKIDYNIPKSYYCSIL